MQESSMSTHSQWARRWAAQLAALVIVVAPAYAQIYEWLDDNNNRHFVNSLERVPAEERDRAKLVAGSVPRESAYDNPPPEPPARPPADNKKTESDRGEERFASGWDAGFTAGWDAGTRAAAADAPICPADSAVVVMESQSPVVVSVPRYDPTGAYYRPSSRLSSGFDDGASIGQTQRQRVQELRTLERGW
jgi:hypothetical protein